MGLLLAQRVTHSQKSAKKHACCYFTSNVLINMNLS